MYSIIESKDFVLSPIINNRLEILLPTISFYLPPVKFPQLICKWANQLLDEIDGAKSGNYYITDGYFVCSVIHIYLTVSITISYNFEDSGCFFFHV